jgi:hypothetical protein
MGIFGVHDQPVDGYREYTGNFVDIRDRRIRELVERRMAEPRAELHRDGDSAAAHEEQSRTKLAQFGIEPAGPRRRRQLTVRVQKPADVLGMYVYAPMAPSGSR